jgi:putative ubiquitin-RnfH superfamily antitoxin RatB of RatAB toxin-antitoxin module
VIVTVVWATTQVHDAVAVEVPAGTAIADAVARSGLIAHYGLEAAAIEFAVFGQRRDAGTLLADGDRVELTRPLVADPNAARLRRAREKPLAKSPPRIKRKRAT